jgi:hypothetical protein
MGLTVSGWALQPAGMAYAADPQSEVCKGIGAASGNNSCASNVSLTRIVRNIINIFSIIIGIAAVIMILFGGFKFITAAGDSGRITSAKHTIVYAIIGLVIAALSQAIVQFVLESVA